MPTVPEVKCGVAVAAVMVVNEDGFLRRLESSHGLIGRLAVRLIGFDEKAWTEETVFLFSTAGALYNDVPMRILAD